MRSDTNNFDIEGRWMAQREAFDCWIPRGPEAQSYVCYSNYSSNYLACVENMGQMPDITVTVKIQ